MAGQGFLTQDPQGTATRWERIVSAGAPAREQHHTMDRKPDNMARQRKIWNSSDVVAFATASVVGGITAFAMTWTGWPYWWCLNISVTFAAVAYLYTVALFVMMDRRATRSDDKGE